MASDKKSEKRRAQRQVARDCGQDGGKNHGAIGVFVTEAPKYVELGLTPLPVERGSKGTFIDNWPSFAHQCYPEKLKTWQKQYPDYGIALPMGKKLDDKLKLGAIDVDVDRIVPFVRRLLGDVPCAKRGKKGLTIFVRADAKLKSASWEPKGEERWVDLLLHGKMTVVPPTIHKDTGEPYVWIDTPLYECDIETLPILDKEKKQILEIVTTSDHTPIIISGKSTHDATLSLSGTLVFRTDLDDEAIISLMTSLFPTDYRGNSLEELPGMIASARENRANMGLNTRSLDLMVAREMQSDLDPLVFIPLEGFRKYDNGYWRLISEHDIEQMAFNYLIPHVQGRLTAPTVKNVVRCLGWLVQRSNFGGYSSLICCKNGTVDVMTGELLDPSPEHELRYQLDINYDPMAECPLYLEQLETTLIDDPKWTCPELVERHSLCFGHYSLESDR